jgi:V8-like Glu-specific endopeptidase
MPTVESKAADGSKLLYSAEGTGFLIADDRVVTAGHVIIDDKTKQYFKNIRIIMEQKTSIDPLWLAAEPITTLDDASKYDLAVLQIKNASKDLPSLEISYAPNVRFQPDVKLGADVAFMGFPFGVRLGQKFCLFGSVASLAARPNFFYQGPAVKGMSGGPILSIETGKVIGVIDKMVADFEAQLNSNLGMGIGTPYLRLILENAKQQPSK